MNPRFPPTLAKILIVALPKDRPENRMSIYRRLVHDSLHGKSGRPPTDKEVSDEIGSVNRQAFSEVESDYLIGQIARCAYIVKQENLQNRAKAGAAARWKKKNGHKAK